MRNIDNTNFFACPYKKLLYSILVWVIISTVLVIVTVTAADLPHAIQQLLVRADKKICVVDVSLLVQP